MGKASRALVAFINGIKDNKLTGFGPQGTIFGDEDFRFDMQCITSDGRFNLQIQVNNQTSISTLKKIAPKTVAGPVLATGDETAQEIREALLDSILI